MVQKLFGENRHKDITIPQAYFSSQNKKRLQKLTIRLATIAPKSF
jgi:hypothetical protein